MQIQAPLPHHTPALRGLWQAAFGDTDDFLDLFWRTAFAPKRCRCVLVEQEVAAALYWFDCTYQDRPITYVYAVATLPSHQGQGLCHRLMEHTHQALASLGYAGVVLVPGSESLFRFYARMGYTTCSHVREFSCTAGEDPLSLRPVDLKEYAALRRRLLPPDSVLQEEENLRFLQGQASLYAGENLLLAARKENDTLVGVELLGDTSTAPALLRTLNCRRGRFRTYGSEKPFAMYLPLTDSPIPPPAYFGLAFD